MIDNLTITIIVILRNSLLRILEVYNHAMTKIKRSIAFLPAKLLAQTFVVLFPCYGDYDFTGATVVAEFA